MAQPWTCGLLDQCMAHGQCKQCCENQYKIRHGNFNHSNQERRFLYFVSKQHHSHHHTHPTKIGKWHTTSLQQFLFTDAKFMSHGSYFVCPHQQAGIKLSSCPQIEQKHGTPCFQKRWKGRWERWKRWKRRRGNPSGRAPIGGAKKGQEECAE